MREWEQYLTEAGCRITAPRRAVIEILQTTQAPLEPPDILRQAQAIHRQLGLVTVYRTLSLLTGLGLVRRVHLAEGCHAYAPVAQVLSHHLICQQCHQVVEFPCAGLEPLIDQVSAQTGFVVNDHLLELVGTCPACQQAEE
ncbi:MAG: transcriptional repressor [Chloroflexi bacterium]|nr:transcriptional repressor [Chloroflexota bacterium]MBU1751830.1 transcriptional repressor [Chloroflexota bacterium]MBU1877391.1 transcriptional repressor [Chloroflexota bacterium]